MTRWQVLCLAEVAGIILAWRLLGGSPASARGEEAPLVESAAAATSAQMPRALPHANRTAIEAGSSETTAAGPLASLPPASTGLVSLIGLVRDEAGAPVRQPEITIHRPGKAPEYLSTFEQENSFLLADLAPGDLDLEIRAAGFVAWRGAVTLTALSPVQRRIFSLRRAWRVTVQVRTTDGSDFQSKMSARLGINPAFMRLHVIVDRKAQTADLPARAWLSSGNEYGEFHSRQFSDQALPEDCIGVLDLATDPPLVATAWMGRVVLGSTPIESGAREIVIVADMEAVAAREAGLMLRVLSLESGEPVAGARVTLAPPTSASATQITDAEGKAHLRNIISQTYDLEVTCEGYAGTYREVIVDPGELLDFGDVRIGRPGEITGIVLDPEGKPVPNLAFSGFHTGAWTRPERSRRFVSRTDAEGRIRLPAVPERFQIIFASPEYGLQAEEWPRGGAEAEARTIVLRHGAEVSLNFTGEHRANRYVWILDTSGRMLMGGTGGYGPWQLVLASGNYLLRVEDLNRNLMGITDLRIPEGGGPVSVEIP